MSDSYDATPKRFEALFGEDSWRRLIDAGLVVEDAEWNRRTYFRIAKYEDKLRELDAIIHR